MNKQLSSRGGIPPSNEKPSYTNEHNVHSQLWPTLSTQPTVQTRRRWQPSAYAGSSCRWRCRRAVALLSLLALWVPLSTGHFEWSRRRLRPEWWSENTTTTGHVQRSDYNAERTTTSLRSDANAAVALSTSPPDVASAGAGTFTVVGEAVFLVTCMRVGVCVCLCVPVCVCVLRMWECVCVLLTRRRFGAQRCEELVGNGRSGVATFVAVCVHFTPGNR